jgi:Transposase IS4
MYQIDKNGKADTPSKGKKNTFIDPEDDSDADDEVDVLNAEEDNINVEEGDDKDSNTPNAFSTVWKVDQPFDGIDACKLFNNKFSKRQTQNTSADEKRTGLQCSENLVNSPIKAWRSISTISILEKIVNYTNECGDVKDEDWTDVTKNNLTDFLSVLFILSVQKRKDRPSWFSNDPFYKTVVIKNIMTGKKFDSMMRCLHVCSIEDQPMCTAQAYDPGYRVHEFSKVLHVRYKILFVPDNTVTG